MIPTVVFAIQVVSETTVKDTTDLNIGTPQPQKSTIIGMQKNKIRSVVLQKRKKTNNKLKASDCAVPKKNVYFIVLPF